MRNKKLEYIESKVCRYCDWYRQHSDVRDVERECGREERQRWKNIKLSKKKKERREVNFIPYFTLFTCLIDMSLS